MAEFQDIVPILEESRASKYTMGYREFARRLGTDIQRSTNIRHLLVPVAEGTKPSLMSFEEWLTVLRGCVRRGLEWRTPWRPVVERSFDRYGGRRTSSLDVVSPGEIIGYRVPWGSKDSHLLRLLGMSLSTGGTE
jgi:hypothetical protein